MITATPLTSEAFAPYGHVARNGNGVTRTIRGGCVLLTMTRARCTHDDMATDFAIDFYDVAPEAAPLTIRQAEQHPHSSQFFVPFRTARYLVVVWPEKPAPGVTLDVFIAGGEDIVIYNPGVWHHGIVALDEQTLFASAMWKTSGDPDDTNFHALETPSCVTWPDVRA